MAFPRKGSASRRAPICCDRPMALIGAGRAATFDLAIWRCLDCEAHERTTVRTDGQTFWVGAMGRAIESEEFRIVANAYGRAT